MGNCSNCRHWRPHAGAPTNMVCGRITSGAIAGGGPRLMLDRVANSEPEQPLRMETPGDYGCVLFEAGAERQ